MMPMKGLLKGLRFISNIFEKEKEEEIQIGVPTDVKHVAHIGTDGPSANTPSWMNKYSDDSELAAGSENNKTKQKESRSSARGDPLDSPTQSKTKHSRRHHSSSSSAHSEDRDSFNQSKPRRHRHSEENAGSDSPSTENLPRIPKSRRKKSKESSSNESLKPFRSKGSDKYPEISPCRDTGPDPGLKNIEDCSEKSVYREESESEEISRRVHAL